MKRLFASLALCLSICGYISAQQAKYVFYFIGDGMGINQVFGTEMYFGELNGKIGPESLLFTQFPYSGLAQTYSHSNSITDSAAAGTALATGEKTTNGVIGMDYTKTKSIETVAEKAKKAGRNVGVATSVSIDHATPASFYAHQPSRKMAYEIGTQLPESGFEFFAGSEFVSPVNKNDAKAKNLYDLVKANGYKVVRGYDEYQANAGKGGKFILFQKEGKDKYSLPLAIDRKADDLTLTQITQAGVDALTKNDKGFFLMVEGGQIDWTSHSNDAASTFYEVQDMDNAIKIAYDFYKQKPDSTLIVVTADHETGGLALGVGKYVLDLKKLKSQKFSQAQLSKEMVKLSAGNKVVTWDMMKNFLKQNLGLGDVVELTAEQESALKDAFDKSYNNDAAKSKSEYFSDERLAALAVSILNNSSKVGWTTKDHSAACVPVFAVGAGADLFTGMMDNTDIPKKIAKAAGY